MDQVVQQVVMTRSARQMRAKNNALVKLREMYPADYEKIYIEEALSVGITPHALTRSKTIAGLEMKLARLKQSEMSAK